MRNIINCNESQTKPSTPIKSIPEKYDLKPRWDIISDLQLKFFKDNGIFTKMQVQYIEDGITYFMRVKDALKFTET